MGEADATVSHPETEIPPAEPVTTKLPLIATARPQPLLPALVGLATLALPIGLVGVLAPLLEQPFKNQNSYALGLDLFLMLAGVRLAWRTPADRRGLWRFGIGPLLAGGAAIGGAALLISLDPASTASVGLSWLGRALAALGTGTLTVYWLRMNTGSIRVPAHRPTLRQHIRTSRSAPILALAAFVACGWYADLLATMYFLPLYLVSAWLVVTLIRAPHSPLTLMLNRVGRTVLRMNRRSRMPAAPSPRPDRPDSKTPSAQPGPVRRRITLPEPGSIENEDDPATDSGNAPASPSNNVLNSTKTYVAASGRVIDLDQIPLELRLLPLPQITGQEEQVATGSQTE
ncbi:hypothetical protein [Kineosporia babensis]|uniref:Uncharacterized protein n=1 Tax=Kineosporia babensis TaxID=499548 RepID=A0A9X1SUX4_9ACTN|nr:hypothetical protein [Kineosporia babensis]MCD5312956.1 hypothetical protein [Kineosporia babensis]